MFVISALWSGNGSKNGKIIGSFDQFRNASMNERRRNGCSSLIRW